MQKPRICPFLWLPVTGGISHSNQSTPKGVPRPKINAHTNGCSSPNDRTHGFPLEILQSRPKQQPAKKRCQRKGATQNRDFRLARFPNLRLRPANLGHGSQNGWLIQQKDDPQIQDSKNSTPPPQPPTLSTKEDYFFYTRPPGPAPKCPKRQPR